MLVISLLSTLKKSFFRVESLETGISFGDTCSFLVSAAFAADAALHAVKHGASNRRKIAMIAAMAIFLFLNLLISFFLLFFIFFVLPLRNR
ncbi:MAG: hypothetical protein Q4A23_00740 [bacterium]|nr:hypothetical protein [bacterium]